jgi:A/G-specific adenine glycosylase
MHYARHGRHALPWRKTKNPYRILVSEIMLQQTQVDRVLPKYQSFVKQFPTITALAHAPLRDVLIAWQGLGYNRRAKLLHVAARQIVEQHRGVVPRTYEALTALPGIGSYTAGAVLAFAFNVPHVIVETNIRSVMIHHFFGDDVDVHDTDIREKVAATLDMRHPREWYWALMDYGTHIKRMHGNPNIRSRHYTKQRAFQGSDRQIRGAIIRALSTARHSRQQLHALIRTEPDRIDAQLERLREEEMITKHGRYYALPE